MKILVAGATGAIGRPLITKLIQAGYDVTGLTRSPKNANWLGVNPPLWVSVADTLKTQGADAVDYATQLRAASNLKAKREINFQPRSLQWLD